MHFRDALKLFSLEGPGAVLTTSRSSNYLMKSLPVLYATDQAFVRMFDTKHISGDLDRLYRMGFMARKRVNRSVVTHQGVQVSRGFEYEYRISKQGWQYLNYLVKPKNKQASTSEQVEKASRHVIIEDLHKRFPESVADYLAGAFSDKKFEDLGRHRRFPKIAKMKLIDELSECQKKLDRKSREIERLKKQINVLRNGRARKE